MVVAPKTSKNGTRVWVKGGDAHVQLFRDFYFGRYKATTKSTKIYKDPERDYRLYNAQTISRKVTEIRKHAATFRELGTGLEDAAFRDRLRLHQPPDDKENKGRHFEIQDDRNEENGGEQMDEDQQPPFYSPPSEKPSSKTDEEEEEESPP